MSSPSRPDVAPPSAAPVPPQRLEHLPVTYFAVVMGLGGLALAWMRAAAVLGAPSAVGVALFWVAAAVYAAVLGGYLLKLVRHPAAVRAEIAHPVRIAFVPTASIGLLLLAAAGRDVVPGVAVGLWWVGTAAQLVLTLAVVNAWIERPVFAMVHVSPAWFIPVVGNLVVPLAGASVAPVEISWFFWSGGLVFWLALLPVVLTRLFVHDVPVPAKLLPTLAILVAPPAVAFVGLLRLAPGAPGIGGRVLYYAAVLFALVLLVQVPRLRRVPFFLSWWAYSFPLAALSVATTLMADLLGGAVLVVAAWALLVLCSLLVALLVIRTVREMVAGRICVPEA